MSIPTTDELLREQAIVVSAIMAQLAGVYTPDRVRCALTLAHSRGYSAALDAAQSIYSPREVAHG